MTGATAVLQTDRWMRLYPAVRPYRRKPKYGRFSERSYKYVAQGAGIKDNVFIDKIRHRTPWILSNPIPEP